jgi:CheY-like chemotaxis protein
MLASEVTLCEINKVFGSRMSVLMDKQTVLLVEDNADDEVLTIRALKKHNLGNQIMVARDGVEALHYLHGQDSNPLPNLILLDLKLPKVDGLEVLRQIRGDVRTKHLPVVILTSSKEDRDLMGCYSLGANSYIRKPVDFIEFSYAVQQLGLYWLVLNQPAPAGRR